MPYADEYFTWQRNLGEFSAKANRFSFTPYVNATDRVVDFGCGGGYLLASLSCAERIGVEINPIARQEAGRQGIKCLASTSEIPEDWADVIISHSALEHVEAPLAELRQLFPKVRPGGLVVFSIPHEALGWAYKPNDINQHLYTWSPMCAGNLFSAAGFWVESVSVDRSMWPPMYGRIYAVVGERGFRLASKLSRWARVAVSPVKTLTADATILVVGRRPKGRHHPVDAV
jgi:SAM-dependent methyltransferase